MIEPVDELVGELPREHALALGLPARVDDDHVQVVAGERPAEQLDEALLAEVLERARQDADEAGATACERAGDRVAGVAQLLRRLLDAPLGLRLRLHPAQRVGHSRRREPRGRGDILDRHAFPRRHTHTVPGAAAGTARTRANVGRIVYV